MTKRRGVTLTELLVVLSVCSVVMTISIALIQRAMHAERRSRTFFNLQRSSLRLADQFRADVRQASAIVDTTCCASSVDRRRDGSSTPTIPHIRKPLSPWSHRDRKRADRDLPASFRHRSDVRSDSPVPGLALLRCRAISRTGESGSSTSVFSSWSSCPRRP